MRKKLEAERSRLSPKLIAGTFVAIFFGVALCLRIFLPYDQVFSSDLIRFTGADAYYHMRLVDSLVHNFPNLISSDPYMIHPGAVLIGRIHFFDWLLAGIIWVISLGTPTQHTINVVGAYFPAVLGALTVIPVYFIGKELFNRWVGVISAGLIAFMPGEFLGRSIAGFTDHDVAGTLFTTVTIMFLILAIKTARQRGLTFNHLKRRDRAIITKPIIYSLLAGIFLGIFLVTWPGALILVLIAFASFIIQFIIDTLRRQSTDYLCLVSVITFLVGLLIFLPATQDIVLVPQKRATHEILSTASLLIALLALPVLVGISRLLTRLHVKSAYHLLALVGLGLIGFVVFRTLNPALFNSMMEAIGMLSPSGVTTTTLEMQPFLFPEGELTLRLVWGNFTTGFFLSIISLIILIICLAIKRGNAERNLFIVWSLVILVFALAQRRFAGYLAVNVALLTGYLSALIFFTIYSIIAYLRDEPNTYLSRQTLESPDIGQLIATPRDITPKRIEKGKTRAKERYRGGFQATTSHVNMALAIIAVFFLAFFPNILKATEDGKETRFAPSDAWIQSLSWLKANTSDPFGDPDYYYEFYDPPKTMDEAIRQSGLLSKELTPAERNDVWEKSYPSPDYTVLAWWDYGYWITRIAHRVPNTNPAQGGVRKVANFFLAQDTDTANETRQGLGSTYIIIDYETVTDKFWAIATWAKREPSEFFEIYYYQQENRLVPVPLYYPEYYYAFSTRLYSFDGKAVTTQSPWVISYRKRATPDGKLIKEITETKEFSSYQEAVAYASSQESANYSIASPDPFRSPVLLKAVPDYQLVYSSESSRRKPGGGMVPGVKIFEYKPTN